MVLRTWYADFFTLNFSSASLRNIALKFNPYRESLTAIYRLRNLAGFSVQILPNLWKFLQLCFTRRIFSRASNFSKSRCFCQRNFGTRRCTWNARTRGKNTRTRYRFSTWRFIKDRFIRYVWAVNLTVLYTFSACFIKQSLSQK